VSSIKSIASEKRYVASRLLKYLCWVNFMIKVVIACEQSDYIRLCGGDNLGHLAERFDRGRRAGCELNSLKGD
jgi:hypothetical protein